MTQNPLTTMRGFSQAVDAAYARAGLADDIALAVRGHRRELGLSQRAYAECRGCSRSLIARAEAGRSDEMTLARAQWLLAGTGYVVAAVEQDADIGPIRPAGAVAGRELVARDDAGRRLPAHLPVRSGARMPPTWWWSRHGRWLSKKVVPAWTYRRPPP